MRCICDSAWACFHTKMILWKQDRKDLKQYSPIDQIPLTVTKSNLLSYLKMHVRYARMSGMKPFLGSATTSLWNLKKLYFHHEHWLKLDIIIEAHKASLANFIHLPPMTCFAHHTLFLSKQGLKFVRWKQLLQIISCRLQSWPITKVQKWISCINKRMHKWQCDTGIWGGNHYL